MIITKKGLYKLVTKPHMFLRDYIKKKKHKFKVLLPKEKKVGIYQYTVVSAVYGVEKYLDDYFKSLVNQTLDFKKHIFLVLVDDGSPDNSANIIKKWQKKYPKNITYIKKENGGQASARNLGLDYVKTEWVTFIDPDDFVNDIYFEEIDKFLVKNKNKNFSMISNNFIFYYEDKKKFSDSHPLKYRFKNNENVVKASSMNGYMQISVNSALYRMSIINKYNLKLNEDIRPSLEDGEFTMRYMLYAPENSFVAFLKKPQYLYRKRSTGDSTLDTGWLNPKNFDDVLQLACINLFQKSIEVKGFVPKEQQKMVLYHLIWHFKRIINNANSISFLSQEQIEKYKALLQEIFTYIDVEEIEKFNLAGAWFYHKVGLLGMMKNYELDYQIVYIDEFDEIKQLVKLRYFSYKKEDAICTINRNETFPIYKKIRRHDFLGDLFVKEYILWIDIKNDGLFNIFIGNKNTRIGFAGKHWHDGLNTNTIKTHFQQQKKSLNDSNFPIQIKAKRKLYQSSYYANKYKSAWLLMDRDTQADDNAEHLYRYIRDKHPEINIFFVLRKESHDWNRLEKDGFKLVSFASIEYEALLVNAVHLISSHVDGYVVDYLPKKYYKDIVNFKYTFLQHGVTQNDLSTWLNSKNISSFVTVSKYEYNSIAGDNNKYKFSPKEVVLTGFPRHDALIRNNSTKEKIILIMPTWRQALVGKVKGKGNKREINKSFSNSSYFIYWKNFLHSKKLEKLSQKFEYKIVFFPHANIQEYIRFFNVPNYINIITHQNSSIQKIFQKASLMITDYSSVAFEMGALYKEVIYYQFDYEELYGGGHFVDKGYFDYKEHGFGPVCSQEDEVLNELELFMKHDGMPEDKYLKRMKDFFAFHDTNNCQRTFDAIVNLDKPSSHSVPQTKLSEILNDAIENKKYKTIESILEYYTDSANLDKEKQILLIEAKAKLGKIEEAETLLKNLRTVFDDEETIESLQDTIKNMETHFSQLTEQERALLINDNTDLFFTLKYKNIEKLFKESKWNVLSVAF